MKQTEVKEKPVDPSLYDKDYYKKYNHGYEDFQKDRNVMPELREKIDILDLENKKVLDIACGRGEVARYAALKGAEKAVGVDYSEDAIKICREMIQDLDPEIMDRIKYERMNARELDFEDNTFDYIFMFDIVEHLHDWELNQALDEAKRVLKPEGKILIHTSPNKLLLDIVRLITKPLGFELKSSEFHVNELTPFTIRKYAKPRFEGKIILEKDKRYWSKQMVFRGKVLNLAANIVDALVDNKISDFLLNLWPFKIVYSTDIWFIGTKKSNSKINLDETQQDKLDKILSKVGDLNFRRRIMTMLEYLNIQKGERVLDIGCGEGFYALIFDEIYDCEIYAVDNDPEILAMAKERLRGREDVNLEKGSIYDLQFADNFFDKIVCTEVLEHIPDDHAAVEELYRVLKPGGKLAVTVPNHNYPFMWDPLNWVRERLGLGHFNPKSGFWGGIWAYDHKRLYFPKNLKDLLENHNLELMKLEVLTHYGVPFNHLVLYVGKQIYTQLPVPEDVEKSMEKFEWEEETEERSPSIISRLLNLGFRFLKWVDSFNDRKFPLDTSTMAVAALVKKSEK